VKTISAGIIAIVGALLSAGLATSSVQADVNENVSSQVTDAVTQSNVKVIGESPAMAMGTLYQAVAHSTGIGFYNAVQAQASAPVSATTLSTVNVQALMAQAQGRFSAALAPNKSSSKAKAYRKIDAITTRLRDCGSDCIINLQIHVEPLGHSVDQGESLEQTTCDAGSMVVSGERYAVEKDSSIAQVFATCIATRMLETRGTPVNGVAVVIPDGDSGARTLNLNSEVAWRDARITSIDVLVQRLL
jgi:hypothetical protein